MKGVPKVTIILVNYNGYYDTVECVKSLLNIDYNNYNIVIVENNSSDQNLLKKDLFLNKNAKIIYADKNEGFSVGNNIGIQYAIENNADYVLLLNNDTIVEENFINALIDTSLQAEDIGIITGNIYYYSESNKLWYAEGQYNRKTGITKMCGKHSQLNQEREVSFVCGCLMLMRKEMIMQIGMLDDSFFLYSEDTEYSCRALENGWKLKWNPEAKIYHKISASTKNNSKFQQYYLIRNNLLMIKKYGKCKVVAYLIRGFYCLKDLVRKRVTLDTIIYAYLDFFKGKFGKTNRFEVKNEN